MPAALHWPEERNDQLRRLLSAGFSIRATSTRMGLTRSTVHRQHHRLAREDQVPPPERKPLPPGDPMSWSAVSSRPWSAPCSCG